MKNTLLLQRSLGFVAFLLLMSVSLHAQNLKDVVYLKNGSIIKGVILEMIPGGTIKIETLDGSVFIYRMDEVERTGKEEDTADFRYGRRFRHHEQSRNERPAVHNRGYFIMGRLGPILQITDIVPSNNINLSGGIINGFYITNFLSLGVGVDAKQYNFSQSQNLNVSVFPVFLDARFYIPRGMVNPMFSFQVGYAFTGPVPSRTNYYDFVPKDHNGGGLLLSFSAGVRVNVNKTFSIIAEGSPSFQTFDGSSTKMVYDATNYVYEIVPSGRKTFAALQLNFGVSYNLGMKRE